MPLSQNDLRALILIAGSREPMNPSTLQAELGVRRETVSRLITHLVKMGAGGAARLRGVAHSSKSLLRNFKNLKKRARCDLCRCECASAAFWFKRSSSNPAKISLNQLQQQVARKPLKSMT